MKIYRAVDDVALTDIDAHTDSTMKPDAIIKVRFRTQDEGGRLKAIWGSHFGCPMEIGSEKFDCRLYPEGQTLEAGLIYELPVKFLCPGNAVPKLSQIGSFTLWEGKTIAEGQLVKICSKDDCRSIESAGTNAHSGAAAV